MGNYHFGPIRFRQSVNDFLLTVALGEKSPAWGLSRWGGSAALRFVPSDDEGFSLRGDSRRLLYKGRRRSHRITILGDGAFEYDCILEKPPGTNTISLFMEGSENFDFFRQPNFLKEPLLAGSYAVYKKETLIGEGTGKLCHIHRPEIIDARGRRCWGDLAVVGNELRITIPERWLSEAAYPVIVDPTIGTATVGSQTTGPDPNNIYYDRPWLDSEYAFNKYLVPQNGNGVCTAYVYCYNMDAYEKALPILYTNQNNAPFMKKSQNENYIDVEVWNNKPAGWRNNTFKINGNITEGEYIWFGLFSSYFTTRFDYGGDCYKGWFDWETYEDYDGEPTPYIHAGSNNTHCTIKWSWYFNYTAITSQSYVRTITQGVTLSDSRKMARNYKRAVTQTARVNSSLKKFEIFCRKCVMTVKNTMTINRLPIFYRTVTEQIKATMGKVEKMSYSRKCSDGVKVNSDTNKNQSFIRTIQDGLKNFDTQSFSVLYLRAVSDNETAFENIRHLRSFIRGMTATVGSIAETTHEAVYKRIQTDTVQAMGTVFRSLIMFVRIVTRVFVRDYLLGRFLKAREELTLKSAICREIVLDSRIG